MEFVTEPSVHLIGKSSLLDEDLRAYLLEKDLIYKNWDGTQSEGELISETAGRLCYMSFANPRPGGTEAYLGHIKNVGHGSVLEHVTYNFIISNVPRYFEVELIRHRAGTAYSIQSGRYCDFSENPIYIPYWISRYEKLKEEYIKASTAVTERYHSLYNKLSFNMKEDPNCEYSETRIKKEARSAARAILPQGITTNIFFTVNARALRHCFEMRCSPGAEEVIRNVFNQIHAIVLEEDYQLFNDYNTEQEADGTYSLTTDNRKV